MTDILIVQSTLLCQEVSLRHVNVEAIEPGHVTRPWIGQHFLVKEQKCAVTYELRVRGDQSFQHIGELPQLEIPSIAKSTFGSLGLN
jgi:hypothetical protein